MRLSALIAALISVVLSASASAVAQTPRVFTHADTLRGSNTPGRAWWDAEFYRPDRADANAGSPSSTTCTCG